MLMETISRWIGGVNDVLWTYVLVAALLGCAVWFTLRTRGVQFRLLGEMMRVLGESAGSGPEGERHVSSFQAFAVSLASRVGTGNLAGVATAIVVGGPGAVFWMWVIALVGAASAFVESTLAQLYKRRGRDSFIGGPAYYMERGLGRRWMGVLFAVLISVTFGFAFNSVQSNTICAAWEGAFGADRVWAGVVLTALTLLIIFGGIRRIARVSGVIVPIMALGYIVLALGVVLFNLGRLPEVLELIVADAFGWEQTLGGAVGAMVLFGSVATLDLAWSLADVTMALMTLCNLAAIVLLGRQAFLLLADYTAQKRQGIKNPVFTKDRIPELKDKAECW